MRKMIVAVLAIILFPFLSFADNAPNVNVKRMGTQGGFNYFRVNSSYNYLNQAHAYTSCIAVKNGKLYSVSYEGRVGKKTCTGAHDVPKLMNPDKAQVFQFTDKNGQKQELPVAWVLNTQHALNPKTKTGFEAAKLYATVEGNDLKFGDEVQELDRDPNDPNEFVIKKQDRMYSGSVPVVPPAPQPTRVDVVLQPLPPAPPVTTTMPTLTMPSFPPAPVVHPAPPRVESKPAPEPASVETKPLSREPACRALAKVFPRGDHEYCESLNDETCTAQNLKYECHFGGQSGCNVNKCLSDYSKAAKSEKIQAALKAIDDAYKAYEQSITAFGQALKDESAGLGVTCMQVPTSSERSLHGAYVKYLRLKKVEGQRGMCRPAASHPSSKRVTKRRTASVDDSAGE